MSSIIEGHLWASDQLRDKKFRQSRRTSFEAPKLQCLNFAELDSGDVVAYDLMTDSDKLSDLFDKITDLRYLGRGRWHHAERIS